MPDDSQSERDSSLEDAIHGLRARQSRLDHMFKYRHSDENKPAQVEDLSSNELSEQSCGVDPVLGTRNKRREFSSAIAGVLFFSLLLSAYLGFRLANPLGSLAF